MSKPHAPHEMQILSQVARLFRAFPAGKNVDEHTLQDYCEAFADFNIEIVAHVVDRFRLGEVKRESHAFPPALAEIMTHIRKRHSFIRLQSEHEALGLGKEQKVIHYILPKTHFLNRTKSNVTGDEKIIAPVTGQGVDQLNASNVARVGEAIAQDLDQL